MGRDAVVFPEVVAVADALLDPAMAQLAWADSGAGRPRALLQLFHPRPVRDAADRRPLPGRGENRCQGRRGDRGRGTDDAAHAAFVTGPRPPALDDQLLFHMIALAPWVPGCRASDHQAGRHRLLQGRAAALNRLPDAPDPAVEDRRHSAERTHAVTASTTSSSPGSHAPSSSPTPSPPCCAANRPGRPPD